MKLIFRWKTEAMWTARVLLALLTTHLSPLASKAQSVESSISSMEMLVGEQVALTVTAHAQDTATVEFPQSLLLPSNIEVLQAVEEPAVNEGSGMVRRQCRYVLTCFEDTSTPCRPSR